MASSSLRALSEKGQFNGDVGYPVKNGFIHFECLADDLVPSPDKLCRASTAPPLQASCRNMEDDSAQMEQKVDVAPFSLSRCSTCDEWESCDYQGEGPDGKLPDVDGIEFEQNLWDLDQSTNCTTTLWANAPPCVSWAPYPGQMMFAPGQLWLQGCAQPERGFVASGQWLSPTGPASGQYSAPSALVGHSKLSDQFEDINQFPMKPIDDWSGGWQIMGEEGRPFEPHTVKWYRNQQTQRVRAKWTISAAKLKGSDRSAVSPEFKLHDGSANAVPFKMVLTPVQVSTQRGGSSFKTAKGEAIVQLKCEAPLPENWNRSIRFWFSATDGQQPCLDDFRGPGACNFSESGLHGLEKDEEVWNLREIVHKESQTFAIFLEVTAL